MSCNGQVDRTQMLDQLEALQQRVKQGAEELAKYADNDPEKLDAMSKLLCSKDCCQCSHVQG